MAFDERTYNHLEELSGSDFEMVHDEPDIIGWTVRTREGQRIGKVHDLLFNPQTRKVRYLIVDLDGNEMHLDTNRRVLIPIGIAELYTKKARREFEVQRKDSESSVPEGNTVVLPNVTVGQLNALPLYEKNHLSPPIEMAIRNIFDDRDDEKRSDRDDFYDHEHFNDDRFYNRDRDRDRDRDEPADRDRR